MLHLRKVFVCTIYNVGIGKEFLLLHNQFKYIYVTKEINRNMKLRNKTDISNLVRISNILMTTLFYSYLINKSLTRYIYSSVPIPTVNKIILV